MNPAKIQLCVIINPIAGRGRASAVSEEILQTINTSIFDVTMKTSSKPGEIETLAHQALQEGAGVIVAVGGDGTVNEIARVIVHTNVILGIIPLGSGNGLANFLKIPKSVKEAVQIINTMNIRSIDTGTINNHFFVSVAGVGFDASVAKDYAKSGSRGFISYLKSSVKKYYRYQPAKYKIRFNNQIISRKALLITFANSDQFGYNTSIAPEARIDDGLFDMCILRKVPLHFTPFVLPRLFTHRIHKSGFHETWKVNEATIFRKRTSVIQVDGEAIRMKDKIIHVKNYRQSLRVIS